MHHPIFATLNPSGSRLTEEECRAASLRVGKYNGPQRKMKKAPSKQATTDGAERCPSS